MNNPGQTESEFTYTKETILASFKKDAEFFLLNTSDTPDSFKKLKGIVDTLQENNKKTSILSEEDINSALQEVMLEKLDMDYEKLSKEIHVEYINGKSLTLAERIASIQDCRGVFKEISKTFPEKKELFNSLSKKYLSNKIQLFITVFNQAYSKLLDKHTKLTIISKTAKTANYSRHSKNQTKTLSPLERNQFIKDTSEKLKEIIKAVNDSSNITDQQKFDLVKCNIKLMILSCADNEEYIEKLYIDIQNAVDTNELKSIVQGIALQIQDEYPMIANKMREAVVLFDPQKQMSRHTASSNTPVINQSQTSKTTQIDESHPSVSQKNSSASSELAQQSTDAQITKAVQSSTLETSATKAESLKPKVQNKSGWLQFFFGKKQTQPTAFNINADSRDKVVKTRQTKATTEKKPANNSLFDSLFNKPIELTDLEPDNLKSADNKDEKQETELQTLH